MHLAILFQSADDALMIRVVFSSQFQDINVLF